ncbi:hypothetical protein [Alcanivorax sp. S71-1-4]|uniref:hypothetical protein n=1 Tax=Alcanivorax sp. S71-1-4 TaxID=1177159 RepID=UPI00135AB67D|nr:hypothetical protein [Alcanivorax sp. S71-1-4]
MRTRGKMTGMLSLVLAGVVVTGCGGGGGSSGGAGNGAGGGTELPGLSGLQGDADNQDLLYFSSSEVSQAGAASTLYVIDPANPGVSSALQMNIEDAADIGVEEFGRAFYVPLYEATINDDGSVEDHRVSDVLYLHNRASGNATSEGFAKVSTVPGDSTPVRVSSENYLRAGFGLVRQNYADAGHAAVVYGLAGNERRVRMTFEETAAPQFAMSPTVRHVVVLEESDSSGYQRYLVLRTHDDLECPGGYRLVQNRSSASPGPGAGQLSSLGVENLLPGNREATSAASLSGPLSDGSHYLVIATVVNAAGGECTSEGASLWRYTPSLPAASSLVQVLDEHDEPLMFPVGVAGGPIMPAARHLARQGDVLYFGVAGAASTGPQDLYRVEGDNWSLLAEQEDNLGYFSGFVIADDGRVAVSAGNAVVSWDSEGNDRQVLDQSNAAWLGIMTEVLGSRDGWIFYNRTDIDGQDNAVAMKMDGSDSLEIANAQWVGASSSGKGESIANMTELSEVFLWRGQDIAAVSAADPKAGAVLLGELEATPENVSMYGLAPGPHRLIQVHADADTATVYYVNTREANSLRRSAVQGAGYQRPVDGF